MKKNLFITQHCTIQREQKSLKIVFDDDSSTIPLSIIENLFIIGNSIKLTNGARGLLLENNKNIFFYTSSYKLQGVLSNTKLQSNYRNRLIQYDAYNNKSLEVAKHIVSKKMDSIAFHFDIKIDRFYSEMFKVDNISELLGYEGLVSNKMFARFKKALLRFGIDDFKKREYRPTKDKVNGLLSFTYTLYSNLLYGLVLSEGFDPYIGFLHKKRGTHYAFVSDLIEYDRAKLTLFVGLLLSKKIIVDDDFDGIYLNYDGRKKFLIEFNKMAQKEFEVSRKNLFNIGEQLV
jgi:CRISPR-associated protein Cas1